MELDLHLNLGWANKSHELNKKYYHPQCEPYRSWSESVFHFHEFPALWSNLDSVLLPQRDPPRCIQEHLWHKKTTSTNTADPRGRKGPAPNPDVKSLTPPPLCFVLWFTSHPQYCTHQWQCPDNHQTYSFERWAEGPHGRWTGWELWPLLDSLGNKAGQWGVTWEKRSSASPGGDSISTSIHFCHQLEKTSAADISRWFL